MANATHVRLAATATRLIAKHGRPLVLVKIDKTGPSFDPVASESVITISGVQLSYAANEIDGNLVRADDKKFLIDASVRIDSDMRIRDLGTGKDIVPLGDWIVGFHEFGGNDTAEVVTDYSIISVEEIKPGSTSMIYKVQARI